MPGARGLTYEPINTLKPVVDDVWIVDGPVIRFGKGWLTLPFPTRMTVLREGNDLFVHSPTPLTRSLAERIDAVGRPRFVIAPNRLHYWWVPDWHSAYPAARVFLAPRVREQAGGRIGFDCEELGEAAYPWEQWIATVAVSGSYMTEFEFLHKASRTLVLADLIENFERARLSLPLRLLTWLGGVQDPDGSMPRDLRLTFSRPALRQAVQTMIDWNPERVIVSHGRWFDRAGQDALRRAFSWL